MAVAEPAGLSPALEQFLAADDGESGDEAAPAPAGDLALGELDITSDNVSLRGLEAQLAAFAGSEVLAAVLDRGLDPREFERQCEAQLADAERASVQDYIAEAGNLARLHEQISSCDGILAGMEAVLGRFQGDLGNISSEIRALQEQSQSMSVRLRNRRAAEAKLAGFLDSLALPPALIEGICQAGEPDESFQEHLAELDRRLAFVGSSAAVRETAAFRDVAPELERLRVRALARVREFLMTRIFALRKPKTNIQILQQSVLLRHARLVAFLRQRGPETLGEVRSAYVETLSRVLSSHFRAYVAAIERLQEPAPSAPELLGDAGSGAIGGVVASLFSRQGGAGGRARARQPPEASFQLGERAAILHHLEQAAVIPHVAEGEGRRLPLEVAFRSVNKLLMDTATSEYLFCADFWGDESAYQELSAPALAVVEAALTAQVQESWDLVGLLLLIRVNGAHALIMTRRRVPCLDGFLDRLTLALWPRFKAVFDAQLASLRSVAVPGEDTRVLPAVLRYAALETSLLLLNADLQDAQLAHNLDRLRGAVLELLSRLARQFRHRRSGTVFLINNFTHLTRALQEAAAQAARIAPPPGGTPPPQSAPLGPTGAEHLRSFEEALGACTAAYVEEVLRRQFGALLSFVAAAEAAAARRQQQQEQEEGAGPEGALPGYGPAEAAPIARDFTAKWQAALETLHRDVAREFEAGATAREVLRAAMTQLLLTYTRFLEQLKAGGGPEAAAVLRDSVTVPSIMYEVKRHNCA